MMGRAYEAEADFIHSGNEAEMGWFLVDIKWYDKRGGHCLLLGAVPRPHHQHCAAPCFASDLSVGSDHG